MAENFLADYENIVIVVSHDRHFLDTVCTHVADVNRQKIKIYTGNYTFWYESSQLAETNKVIRIKKTGEKRKDLMDFIARFRLPTLLESKQILRVKALENWLLKISHLPIGKYPGIISNNNVRSRKPDTER